MIHPEVRAWIEAHFELRTTPEDERRMRAHLIECAACRAYYERQLEWSRIDPKAPQAMERLAAGLGLRPRWNVLPLHRPMFATLAVVACAALAFWLLPRMESHESQPGLALAPADEHTTPLDLADDGAGFSARGVDSAVALTIYAINQDDLATALAPGASISGNTELAFAYSNNTDRGFLMVFAVDALGEVRWYYPAWTRADENPSAIAIDRTTATRRLDEAVRHALPTGALTIYGLFTKDALDVRRVEAALGAQGIDRARLKLDPGDRLWSHQLEVVR